MLSITFDAQKSLDAKGYGKAQAARAQSIVLCWARIIAREIALQHPQRLCDIDKVQKRLSQMGYQPKDLGMAAGSVFLPSRWRFVGYVPTTRVSSHARQIMVWQLK